MKKHLFYILPVIAAVALATPASAADMRGRVETVNEAGKQFTLRNGIIFHYGAGIDVGGLSEGAKVKVKYDTENGDFVVKSLRVTSPAKH